MKLLVACLALAFVACQPLYGGKPEHLHTPEKKKKPPEAEGPAVEVKYVDDCNADFRDAPKKNLPAAQMSMSRQLADAGDAALTQGDKEKVEQKKVDLWREAIDKYRNALVKDPYNITATLQLAVAYDKLMRKGCAIAMLKRLATLSNNPKWAGEANRNIDSIDSNGQWFKGYRKDALAAVGR
jgi:tetratricopeptide (TPR) repeat protein